MGKDKRGLGDVEFTGKLKTQTFKQFQLEQLIRDGTVIPASKLAEAKDQELQRSRDFIAASIDEERHRRSATPAPKDKLESLPLTREPFED
jgi:type IV secretory pathway VirD2 relaxase